jgi:hypothetical protein
MTFRQYELDAEVLGHTMSQEWKFDDATDSFITQCVRCGDRIVVYQDSDPKGDALERPCRLRR